jgi:glycogen(starch) synthase
MRILHLAYEDPLQPGSGGGALRTWEVNRRLAVRHQITAVVAGYPGAQSRLEDGVRWVPIGLHTGKKLDQLSYLALVPRAVRAVRHDLVVEDFGPPWSVAFSPLFTRKPVVAMVNWFFTAQIRHLYRLPVDWVERAGLPLYHDFISMSNWSARAIERRLAPRPARVAIIPNGVQDAAFAVPLQLPRHFLFVGRLDLHPRPPWCGGTAAAGRWDREG